MTLNRAARRGNCGLRPCQQCKATVPTTAKKCDHYGCGFVFPAAGDKPNGGLQLALWESTPARAATSVMSAAEMLHKAVITKHGPVAGATAIITGYVGRFHGVAKSQITFLRLCAGLKRTLRVTLSAP